MEENAASCLASQDEVGAGGRRLSVATSTVVANKLGPRRVAAAIVTTQRMLECRPHRETTRQTTPAKVAATSSMCLRSSPLLSST